MKRKFTSASRILLAVYRSMLMLVLLLLVLLAAGTVYSCFRSSGSGPVFRIGGSQADGNTGRTGGIPGRSESGSAAGGAINVFSGIGRLRIPLTGGPAAASNSATLVLSIAFPYPSDDWAFTEELASKVGEFRTIATEYFASLPAEKLVNLDESAAKVEILRRYNASLRLGKIEALYFSDLMIIE